MTEKNNRTAAIIKLVVWSVVLVILLSVFCSSIAGSGMNFGTNGFMLFGGTFYDDADTYEVGNREYSGALKNIDIEWFAGSVKLIVYDGEELMVEENYSGEDENIMRSKLVGDKLTVKFCASGLRWFHSYPEKDLAVYIPSRYASKLGNIKISLASSSFEADGISARKLDVDMASGNIAVKNSTVSEVDIDGASGMTDIAGKFDFVNIDTASGDVKINGEVGELDVDSASGRVDFEGGTVNSINADSASGGCNFNLDRLPQSIEFDTASGDFRLFAPCGEDEGFSVEYDGASGRANIQGLDGRTDSGKYLTFGKGNYRYEIDSASGSFYYTETQGK